MRNSNPQVRQYSWKVVREKRSHCLDYSCTISSFCVEPIEAMHWVIGLEHLQRLLDKVWTNHHDFRTCFAAARSERSVSGALITSEICSGDETNTMCLSGDSRAKGRPSDFNTSGSVYCRMIKHTLSNAFCSMLGPSNRYLQPSYRLRKPVKSALICFFWLVC